MTRLKKKAWVEMAATGILFVLILIQSFLRLVQVNAQGIHLVFIMLFVGVPTGVIMYHIEYRRFRQCDEREKKIICKAFLISAFVFIFYLILFSLSAFFLIGGSGNIPVVFMPTMVLVGVFLGQCTQSFIILIECAKDDNE